MKKPKEVNEMITENDSLLIIIYCTLLNNSIFSLHEQKDKKKWPYSIS